MYRQCRSVSPSGRKNWPSCLVLLTKSCQIYFNYCWLILIPPSPSFGPEHNCNCSLLLVPKNRKGLNHQGAPYSILTKTFLTFSLWSTRRWVGNLERIDHRTTILKRNHDCSFCAMHYESMKSTRKNKLMILRLYCPVVSLKWLRIGKAYGSHKPNQSLLYLWAAEESYQFAQGRVGWAVTGSSCLVPSGLGADLVAFLYRICARDVSRRIPNIPFYRRIDANV